MKKKLVIRAALLLLTHNSIFDPMTLQQFFEWIQQHPSNVLYYYAALLLSTIALNSMSEQKSHLYPWNWLYSVIIYAVCIPGIFAITLNVYFFLFEKRSIMDTELLLQFLPVLMLFLIIYYIRKNVDLDMIPGFEKLYGLIWIMSMVIIFMWVIDRTHLYAISFVPFYYVLILLVAGIFIIRYFARKMM